MNAPVKIDISDIGCSTTGPASTSLASLHDRDQLAVQTGRILQSCSIVENALFRIVAERTDIHGFEKIERSKAPAFRNVIAKVIAVLDHEIEIKTNNFKNPKAFHEKLIEFDKAASLRSDLAHSEFIEACTVDGKRIVILSNEGIAGIQCGGRRIQLMSFEELERRTVRAHQLANSLRQVIQNQITLNPKTESTPPPSQPQPSPPATGDP